jgi:hypothetical protein
MPFQSLPLNRERKKRSVVVIVLIIWMIMTIRSGSAWLTPTEVAFVALLLGQPIPVRGDISD